MTGQQLSPVEVYKLYAEKVTESSKPSKFLGAPYPITKHPLGFFHTQSGLGQIKSDLLCLLLTNPGERVMLPEFGTPLRRMVFQPNDNMSKTEIINMVSNSVSTWEPRIVVSSINAQSGPELERGSLPTQESSDNESVMLLSIDFADFDELQKVEQLKLELPLAGGSNA